MHKEVRMVFVRALASHSHSSEMELKEWARASVVVVVAAAVLAAVA